MMSFENAFIFGVVRRMTFDGLIEMAETTTGKTCVETGETSTGFFCTVSP